ncbi:MAG: hypothetical protein ACK4RK_10990 [Gemmataceae bacterium]
MTISSAPQVGDQVPDLEFRRPDDTPARLSEFCDRPLLLIFLRHLA